jgi:glyoxylase-like metal-dependent hydrolase (beta-lactamase superfamily II)
MTLKSQTIVNGPFQENCFLVWDDDVKKGIFIDPGAEPEKLMRTASFINVEIEGIYNTHAHIDHTGGVALIQNTLGIPFALHSADLFMLDGLPNQARMFGLPPMEAPTVNRELAEGDTVQVGEYTGKVLYTPGHTPGGVSFLFDDVVFVGDTLFSGSIGRTDLPGGSMEQLMSSIQEKLLVLDDDVKVMCGHGPSTTIGVERAHNPFLNGRFF